jgi:hypothetical protein
MSDFTRCAFSLPYKVTTATQIRLTLTNSAIGATTVTATAAFGTYYNDLDVSGVVLGVNLLRHLLDQLEAEEAIAGTNGTYILVLQSGDYRGRYTIQRTQGDAADNVASLEILAGGEVTMQTFGYTSTAPTPTSGTANPAVFEAPNRAAGHWIIDDYPGLCAGDEEVFETTVLSATSPDGTTARDTYGDVTRKTIMLMTLPAASVFRYWTDDADFASGLGCATGDPNASLDELRRLWSRLDADVYCRYTPNIGSISTFVQLQPGARDEWLARLPAERVSSNPLLYDVTLTAFVVS